MPAPASTRAPARTGPRGETVSGADGARPGCPICGGASTVAFVVGDRNRGLGPGSFAYRRCARCRTVFIEAPPDDLGRYYASEGYGRGGEPSEQQLGYERAKLEMLRTRVAAGRLVEIGPGPGTFARLAAAAGFEVLVIERDRRYAEGLAGEVAAIESEDPASALRELEEPVDAIAMWHVLEHLPQPLAVLDACASVLRPGGVLAISTPNPDSFQFRVLGRRWMHVDAPRHLQLIPLDALRARLSERGLSMATVTTTDPVGKALNYMAWERALRSGSSRSHNRVSALSAAALTVAAKPLESRGLWGAGYTAMFVKGA